MPRVAVHEDRRARRALEAPLARHGPGRQRGKYRIICALSYNPAYKPPYKQERRDVIRQRKGLDGPGPAAGSERWLSDRTTSAATARLFVQKQKRAPASPRVMPASDKKVKFAGSTQADPEI